jgi:hypothetical protein
VLIYTIGTTGKPKGAELTHFQLYMNCTISGQLFGARPDDVTLAVLPFFRAARPAASAACRRPTERAGGLSADLPDPAGDVGKRQAPFVPDGIDRSLVCALLICCPPVGMAWLLAARRRARAGGGPGAADR